MKQLNTRRSAVALLLTVTFAMPALAEGMGDIPVIPINPGRIPVDSTPVVTRPTVSDAVDQAIFDAMAKSLPPETMQQVKQIHANGGVDEYGRPVTGMTSKDLANAGSLVPSMPTVRTELNPQPMTPPAAAVQQVNASPVPPIAQVAGRDPVVDKVRKKYKPTQQITLKPGHSELIPVATGLQNRIATPFRNAKVKTSDMETPIETEGGYVYITPMSQAPIGLMIGEEGMPETMVSLTLMPLDVPPVMVDMKVDMSESMKRNHAAHLAEQDKVSAKKEHMAEIIEAPRVPNDPRSNPKHIDRATSILAEVAGGGIPAGFDLLDEIPEEERYPCDINRMTMYHEVGQRLVSAREVIDVVRVKNDINGFREIREEFCLADDVISVGVFDRATLAPGEDAEVYILRDKLHSDKMKKIRLRPRLTTTY